MNEADGPWCAALCSALLFARALQASDRFGLLLWVPAIVASLPEAHSRRTRKSTTHRPFGPHPHALAGRGGQRRAAAGSGVLRVSSHPPFAGKVREHCGGASPVANAVGVLHGGRLAGRGAVGCRWLAALTWAQPIFRLSPNA